MNLGFTPLVSAYNCHKHEEHYPSRGSHQLQWSLVVYDRTVKINPQAVLTFVEVIQCSELIMPQNHLPTTYFLHKTTKC